jgi:lysozyme family protein
MDVIDRTIAREGGFVDHPEDPGGATNMGITRATLSRHRGRVCTIDDVRALTRDEARAIYRAEYLAGPGFDRVADPWLQEVLFDAGVLLGPGRPTRWLQAAAGVRVDGALGPVTVAAVNAGDARALGLAVVTAWLRHHAGRVQAGRASPAFIAGWVRRASGHLKRLPLDDGAPTHEKGPSAPGRVGRRKGREAGGTGT